MKFDDLLRELGEFGPYQKWVYFFTCVPALSVGACMLLNVIVFGVPDHRCKIPGLDNDTWDITTQEQEALVKYYIPPSDDYPYDRCHLYSRNGSSLFGNGNISNQVKCNEWVYDTSVFKATFTKQANLVCDDALLISHAQTVYYFGVLVGNIVLGQLSDMTKEVTVCWFDDSNVGSYLSDFRPRVLQFRCDLLSTRNLIYWLIDVRICDWNGVCWTVKAKFGRERYTHIWVNWGIVSHFDVLSTSGLEENSAVYRRALCHLRCIYLYYARIPEMVVK